MAELFELAGKISVDATKANDEIDGTTKKVEELAKKLVELAAKLIGKSAEDLNAVNEFSETFGMTTDEVQELNYVLSKCGSTLNGFTSPMTMLANAMKSAQAGSKGTIEMFEGLGVAVTDSEGNMRSASDVLWETLAALESMEDQMSRTATANKLFGGSGANLMKVLAQEETTIADLRQEAHDLGLILSGEMVQAGGDFTDSWETLQMQMNAAGTAIGGAFLPMLNILLDKILEHSPAILEGIKTVSEYVMNNAEPLANAIENISAALFAMWSLNHPFLTMLVAFVGELPEIVKALQFDPADYEETIPQRSAGELLSPNATGGMSPLAAFQIMQEAQATVEVGAEMEEGAADDLQGELNGMELGVDVKLKPDASGLGYFTSGVRPNTIDGIHANGIDYIPRDGYHALLHEGEAVLNRTEASAWRGGGSGSAASIASAVRDAVAGIQFNIVMDNGAVVGQLAHGMDRELGNIAGRKGRRN